MVFTKLTDTDREQLAIFGQEHDKKQVSMMRALIMRGASPNEAKTMAIEREKARNDVVEALEREQKQREDENEEEEKAMKPKTKRAPRKSKVPVIEEDKENTPPRSPSPPPSPKIKRTRSKKIPTPKEEIEEESLNQITILA